MTVIVIALQYDIHVDAVIDCFANRDNICRIDPLEAATRLSFNSEEQTIEIDSFFILPKDITGIYCRYAIESSGTSSIESPVSRYQREENLGVLCGVFLHVPAEKWINFPWSESIASGKIYPLTAAMRLGIRVPSFIVTNTLASLDKFLEQSRCSEYVIKPISDASIAKQCGEFTDIPDFAAFDAPYTQIFIRENVSEDSFDNTPFLIQQKIEKVSEIRCVVIDNDVLATESIFNPDGEVDIRLQFNRRESVYSLSVSLRDKVLRLKKSLNLRFFTLDFSVDSAGELWLTDVNPAGNWLWQEQQLGLGIPMKIASALSEGGVV